MNLLKKVGLIAAGSALTVAGLIGANAALAQAPDGTVTSPVVIEELPGDGTMPFDKGEMRGGPRGMSGDRQQALADALGITVEALQAAIEEVRSSAGDESDGMHGPRIDREAHQQALADALGISVEALEAAQDTARQNMLDQAVADGRLTEEQAANIQAREALEDYIDAQAITQSVLGMTQEEIQAARDAGQRMDDILAEAGFDRESFRAAVEAKVDEAVQQAVADGVITQAQADQFAARPGPFGGFGPRGHGPRGHHGPRNGEMGTPDGMGPERDGTTPDETAPDETPADSTPTETTL
ncbi:MAG: hypothetical protein KDD73_03605 [Anaerolineales bacterium]|nr:hypothetical protein [Anaerolineales bacterium]MCB9129044.1 hypothetical protein [Ardenticatenales bacterium]MCB9172469.1 hypothetical protein [Ardenticatenales bacterium]